MILSLQVGQPLIPGAIHQEHPHLLGHLYLLHPVPQLPMCHLGQCQLVPIRLDQLHHTPLDLLDSTLQDLDLLDSTLQDLDRLDSTLQDLDLLDSTLQDLDLLDSTLQDLDLLDSTLQDLDLLDSTLQDLDLLDSILLPLLFLIPQHPLVLTLPHLLDRILQHPQAPQDPFQILLLMVLQVVAHILRRLCQPLLLLCHILRQICPFLHLQGHLVKQTQLPLQLQVLGETCHLGHTGQQWVGSIQTQICHILPPCHMPNHLVLHLPFPGVRSHLELGGPQHPVRSLHLQDNIQLQGSMLHQALLTLNTDKFLRGRDAAFHLYLLLVIFLSKLLGLKEQIAEPIAIHI